MAVQMEWWTPVPWLIAAIGIGVSIYIFQRNRYPSVIVLRMTTECLAKYPEWDYHDYLTVELACRGADMYDFELLLECKHQYWYRTAKLFSWRLGSVFRSYRFESTSPLPNPFKNGQVVTLILPDHPFRNLRDRKILDPRTPSQLWPGRVRLVAYHAGRRRVLNSSAWRFWRVLRNFDYLCRHPERAASLSSKRC